MMQIAPAGRGWRTRPKRSWCRGRPGVSVLPAPHPRPARAWSKRWPVGRIQAPTGSCWMPPRGLRGSGAWQRAGRGSAPSRRMALPSDVRRPEPRSGAQARAGPAEGRGTPRQPAAGTAPRRWLRTTCESMRRLLDAVAERATQVRIMAPRRPAVGDPDATSWPAWRSEGLREPQPAQVCRPSLATMLRRTANGAGGPASGAWSARPKSSWRRMLALSSSSRSAPSSAPSRRYAREIARLARQGGRGRARGEETRLDRRIARELEDGPAPPGAQCRRPRPRRPRGARPPGKPRCGRLPSAPWETRRKVRLVVEDDGAGIDLDAVRERARGGRAGRSGRPGEDGRCRRCGACCLVPGFHHQAAGVRGLRGAGAGSTSWPQPRLGSAARSSSTAASATVRP